MTNAFGPNVSRESSIDRTQFPQFLKQRQHRQAEDREVVTIDFVEELNALAFQLIGTDAAKRLFSDPRQVARDEICR